MDVINSNIEIAAKRIVLRPVDMRYKEHICREFTTEVTRYMPFTPDGDITITEAFIRNSAQELRNQTSLQLCILLKTNGDEFLGCCGLHQLQTKAIEIGLWIKMSAHGKGYGKETVKALIDWADNQFDFDYFLYPVDKDNIASRRIPEGLGFKAAKNYSRRKSEIEKLDIVEYRNIKSDRS